MYRFEKKSPNVRYLSGTIFFDNEPSDPSDVIVFADGEFYKFIVYTEQEQMIHTLEGSWHASFDDFDHLYEHLTEWYGKRVLFVIPNHKHCMLDFVHYKLESL